MRPPNVQIILITFKRIHSAPLTKFERILAFIEAVVAFWLAYPCTIVLAQLLLQTAPPENAVQMVALRRAIQDVGRDLILSPCMKKQPLTADILSTDQGPSVGSTCDQSSYMATHNTRSSPPLALLEK